MFFLNFNGFLSSSLTLALAFLAICFNHLLFLAYFVSLSLIRCFRARKWTVYVSTERNMCISNTTDLQSSAIISTSSRVANIIGDPSHIIFIISFSIVHFECVQLSIPEIIIRNFWNGEPERTVVLHPALTSPHSSNE